MLAVVCLCSENRHQLSVRTLVYGVAAQLFIAFVVLRIDAARQIFLMLGQAVDALTAATLAGTGLVFGFVGGGPAPFETAHPENSFVLAFQALPAVLYHWRLLPWVVRQVSVPLQRMFGLGGAVGMSAAAMPFLGMVESPLLIRPYLSQLTRGELFILMTGGMSTIAGSVMILYATFLKGIIPDPIGHLLTSALMGIPLAIAIAKIICPDQTAGAQGQSALPSRYYSSVDAVMQGTMDGVRIVVGIVAVLIVTIALVHLVNSVLSILPGDLSLQRVAGWVMQPVAWGLGIPADETARAGALLGEKVVLNELIAFSDLARNSAAQLSEHSRLILVYALCSFSNFGSLAILVGGLSTMAPDRRAEIIALGPKALLAGTITSCLNGAVAGLILT